MPNYALTITIYAKLKNDRESRLVSDQIGRLAAKHVQKTKPKSKPVWFAHQPRTVSSYSWGD